MLWHLVVILQLNITYERERERQFDQVFREPAHTWSSEKSNEINQIDVELSLLMEANA